MESTGVTTRTELPGLALPLELLEHVLAYSFLRPWGGHGGRPRLDSPAPALDSQRRFGSEVLQVQANRLIAAAPGRRSTAARDARHTRARGQQQLTKRVPTHLPTPRCPSPADWGSGPSSSCYAFLRLAYAVIQTWAGPFSTENVV